MLFFSFEDNFLAVAVTTKPDNFRSVTTKPDRSDWQLLTRANVGPRKFPFFSKEFSNNISFLYSTKIWIFEDQRNFKWKSAKSKNLLDLFNPFKPPCCLMIITSSHVKVHLIVPDGIPSTMTGPFHVHMDGFRRNSFRGVDNNWNDPQPRVVIFVPKPKNRTWLL